MVIVVGIDPATYIAARYTLADNIPELDWAGGLSGQPMECIEGEVTGLPFPARRVGSRGWVSPDETALEGPFSEWTGYAGDAKEEPVIISSAFITATTYSNLRRQPETAHSHLFERCFIRSAGCWTHWKGPVFLM